MSAESLVNLAEQRGLLDAKTVAKLRQQLQQAGSSVSAEKVVKVLVKGGKLTEFQGKTLLDELTAAMKTSDSSQLGLALGSGVDLLKPEAQQQAPPNDPQPVPAAEDFDGLAPLEEADELVDGLVPLEEADDIDGLVPLEEADDIDSLVPLDDVSASHDLVPLEEHEETEGLVAFHDDDGQPPILPPPVLPPRIDDQAEAADLDELAGEAGLAPSKLTKKKGLFGGLFPRRSGPPKIRKNRWDSPLLLLGGGGLVLLSLAGLLLWYVLTRSTGDEVFSLAEQDYQSQSYTQAIGKYEQFLTQFPAHPKVSLAHCRISLAKMRQVVEARDWQRALDISSEQLGIAKSEESFPDVMPELQGILPEIYEGFVDAAQNAEATDQKEQLLAKANAALALVDNPEYLPTSQRRPLQPRMEKIAKEISLIQRDIEREKDLAATIAQIAQAAAAGSTAEAYGFRKQLLERYPELGSNTDLRDAVLKITQAEVDRVEVISSPLAATSEDHAKKSVVEVVLADRQLTQPAALTDEILFVLAQGSVYGLSGSTGEVLWRRWLGFESLVSPARISREAGADAIVLDQRRGELLRLDARTGKLIWRLPIGEAAAAPLVADNRLLLATASGKLLDVNPQNGTAERHIQVPQGLVAPPALDVSRSLIYVPGEHSSLYVCDADSLDCREVFYLGHRPGTVVLPPVVTSGFVFVIEGGGPSYSLLHVIATNSNGLELTPAIETVRLSGPVSQPMLVAGKRVVIVTDTGEVSVYVADTSTNEDPIRLIARRPSSADATMHYAVVQGAQIFVAAEKLIQYELQVSRGELVQKWVDANEDVYVGPLAFINNVLIHQRRREGSYAITVAAVQVAARASAQRPETLWEVSLGIPPASQPLLAKNGVVCFSSDGSLWKIGGGQFKQGRLDQAVHPLATELTPPFAEARALGDKLMVLPPANGTAGMLLYDPSAARLLQYVKFRIPNPRLATPPVPFAEQSLLACTTDGPVYLLDAEGQPIVLPYQPSLEPGVTVDWISPTQVGEFAVVADQQGNVFRLARQEQPKPHLTAVASKSLNLRLAGELAALGKMIFANVRGEGMGNDKIIVLAADELSIQGTVECDGQVVWGPRALNNVVLVATDRQQLKALAADGREVWNASSPGVLAGTPLSLGGALICTTENGKVFRIAESNGQLQPWQAGQPDFDLEEPLGAGATAYADYLLLPSRDSTLHFVKIPSN